MCAAGVKADLFFLSELVVNTQRCVPVCLNLKSWFVPSFEQISLNWNIAAYVAAQFPPVEKCTQNKCAHKKLVSCLKVKETAVKP